MSGNITDRPAADAHDNVNPNDTLYPRNKQDVYNAYAALLHLLPAELVPAVLHHAQYCTRKSVESSEHVHVTASDSDIERRQVLVTEPSLTKLESGRVYKVRFTVDARDQGWCSFPDLGSFSWFEVGILRGEAESHEVHGQRRLVENELCGKESQKQEIEWSVDDEDEDTSEWVRSLVHGDRIAIYACAQYGAWQNQVQFAKIDMLTPDVR